MGTVNAPSSSSFCDAVNSVRLRDDTALPIASSPSRVTLPRPSWRSRRHLISLSPRCNVVSDGLTHDSSLDPITSATSSISSIDQLKISGADRYTREKSSIIAVGISFRTAPVELREKLAIPEALLPEVIEDLCSLNHVEEASVLSTCHRLEIYVVALSQQRGVKEVTEWMSKVSGIPVSEICEHRFVLSNEEVTEHLFLVSAGLDSLVLGEGQILAQVKHVVKASQGVAGFGRKISGLFKHAITVGKRVRTETAISTGAVSVSSAAVELALMKLSSSSFGGVQVLVVGTGKMGRLVIKHLAAKGCRKIVAINRTEEKVTAIRNELKDAAEIIYRPLSEMHACARDAQVVFVSTTSEAPLFLKEDAGSLPVPKSGERLFVDISVPRNVGSCVSELENVRVFNVDDLKEAVSVNAKDRMGELLAAHEIVMEECREFEDWKDSLQTVPTIKKLRAYAERIRETEMERCMMKIGEELTKKHKDAVRSMAAAIVNKLLQGPMQHLRCSSHQRRSLDDILQNMHILNRMFGLETEMLDLQQKIRAKAEKKKKIDARE